MKKLKTVNGIKLLKRYSFSAFLTGILSLALAAIPVLMALMPIAQFDFVVAGETITVGPTGLDFFMNMLNMPSESFAIYPELVQSSLQGIPSEFIPMVVQYVNIAIAVTWALAAVFAIPLLFVGLGFLFVGRVKKLGSAKVLSKFIGVFIVLSVGLVLATGYRISLETPELLKFDLPLMGIIYLGAGIVGSFILSIIYKAAFKNRLYIGDVGDMVDTPITKKEENSSKEESVKVEETKKEEEKPAKMVTSIPQKITAIGGHAFAENTMLKDAIIPTKIKKLGEAAFANCGSLIEVVIHAGVKEIGANCFFNCTSLKTIKFLGTKKQWVKIKRGSNWLLKSGTDIVTCKDGAIKVNQLK